MHTHFDPVSKKWDIFYLFTLLGYASTKYIKMTEYVVDKLYM